jgi:DNA-binding transcriptional LysR family regulator
MFEQMTTFVRIAEMGSITRAARSLGLSLPMASRHLRWLEQELGTALVHRTTRQLHLTDAGQQFATRARALLLGLDDAKEALRPGPSLAGRVVVTAPNALGTYQLSSIMPSLAARHPRLRVELRLEDRAVVAKNSFRMDSGSLVERPGLGAYRIQALDSRLTVGLRCGNVAA